VYGQERCSGFPQRKLDELVERPALQYPMERQRRMTALREAEREQLIVSVNP
jgi:hypothetical protein